MLQWVFAKLDPAAVRRDPNESQLFEDDQAGEIGYEILPNKYFYRYQPPTPAKDLLKEFWRLEKEAEKLLEGLAQ